MKSIQNLGGFSAGRPLPADEILEFHAARLLLLFSHCGQGGKISGLTKMAKLDFFVRYPAFFEKIAQSLGEPMASATTDVESSMVRHHYGPWDKRYYQVLSYLQAKDLITIAKDKNAFDLSLTANGKAIAKKLSETSQFEDIVSQMKRVKRILGAKTGTALKKLIYEVFESEVAQERMGATIK